MLPYIEQDALYSQFLLDKDFAVLYEPGGDPGNVNRALTIGDAPKTYICPSDPLANQLKNISNYLPVTGGGNGTAIPTGTTPAGDGSIPTPIDPTNGPLGTSCYAPSLNTFVIYTNGVRLTTHGSGRRPSRTARRTPT